jgi:hypothetical protein
MKITPKKIFHFFEGNLKLFGDYIHLLPLHEKEQVLYRSEICKEDCIRDGYCKYCGCSVPGKLYVTESCNGGERFPNLMNSKDWKEYKKENNIEIHGDIQN